MTLCVIKQDEPKKKEVEYMTKTTRTLSNPNNNLSTQLGSLANDDMNAAKINSQLTCQGCKYANVEVPTPAYAKRPHGVKEWARPVQCENPKSRIYGCWLNLIESNGNLVKRIVQPRCDLYEER